MSDPIFLTEINDGKGNYLEIKLPATDYDLLDALERLNLPSSENPACTIYQYNSYSFLARATDEHKTLFETNALARKLSELDSYESLSLEGLVQMEVEKGEGLLTLPKLIDLAYSADCCNYAPAYTDEDLGRFYADNNFLPELESIPDEIYKLLDFGKIGKNIREGEHGVFTPRGYVVQTSDLNQVSEGMDFHPHKPDYVFRLTLGSTEHARTAVVELPADQHHLDQALESLGLHSLEGATLKDFDGVSLGLDPDLYFMGSLENLNELAKSVAELDSRGKLPVLKSLIYATSSHTVEAAQNFASAIDDYILESSQRSVEDLARDDLRFSLDESTADILLPHVNLFAYGQELLKVYQSAVTPYGVIQHKDGCPLQQLTEQTPEPTMEMR